MDSSNLQATPLVANPPKPAAAKKPALTLDIVVQRWIEAHGRSVEASLRLGWLAQKFLLARLRSASDAGERRRMRAAAIHEIESRLHASGLRGDSLGVARHIRCAATYDLLRDDCQAIPSWRALMALSPLVTRNPANDSWSCPKTRIEKAHVLFRAAAERKRNIDQVAGDVRQILGKKQTPRKHATAYDRAVAAIGRLDSLAYLQQLQVEIQRKISGFKAAA